MARKPARPPPPPPWVWGPSEINAWIEGAYPAEKRRPKARRMARRGVGRLRLRCRTATSSAVRQALADALRRADYADAEEARGAVAGRARGGHRAVGRVRASLRRGTFLATITFDPAVRPAVARRIVRRIRERIEVLAVAESLRP